MKEDVRAVTCQEKDQVKVKDMQAPSIQEKDDMIVRITVF